MNIPTVKISTVNMPTVNIKRLLGNLGVDPRIAVASARGLAKYRRDREAFSRQSELAKGEFLLGNRLPYLSDNQESAGTAKGPYFHQDLYVAQEIYNARPTKHVDVGSRVDGFVAHVAAYRELEVHDIRSIRSSATGISFVERDIMVENPLYDEYTDSLSCLHALEHFGLGRYGDPINYYGYRDGLQNLVRMLVPGGVLYLSVPAAKVQRIEFNAHRIFCLPYLLDLVATQGLTLQRLAVVKDDGNIHRAVEPTPDQVKNTFNMDHGCLIMTLRRDR